jgi:superfamily I DNA/RNA helicase
VNKEKLEFLLAQSVEDEKDEDEEGNATRKASHVITVKDRETGDIDELTTNKDIMELEFSYAMTVHKSQGSEWRKVYFIMHDCHKNVTRELLYTGMTRAREELVLLYSKGQGIGSDLSRSSIAKAINRQEIVGRTWQEKAQVYKMKLNNGNADIAVDMDWFVE